MVRQCFLTKSGVRFNTAALREIGFDPASLYPDVKKRPDPVLVPPAPDAPPRTEEEHDALDAYRPIYDQLGIKLWWWMLEFIPVSRWVRTAESKWIKESTYVLLPSYRGRHTDCDVGGGTWDEVERCTANTSTDSTLR